MIEIRNCSKAFGEIHAIDHVLMEIGERQIFGLVDVYGFFQMFLSRILDQEPEKLDILQDLIRGDLK